MSDRETEISKEQAATRSAPGPEAGAEHWERDLINRLLFAAVNEQRRARRWGIFFKSLGFAYLFILLLMVFGAGMESAPIRAARHTALVEVQGEIADNTQASADQIITGLRRAFEDKRTAGVILRINSPGGSPVQAGYINDEIVRLRKQYPETPLYAVITDICASGGYYVAAAADRIYADKASIVGSIGVVMNGFGFVDTMNKLAVDRRLLTAGDHKGFLDPFSPAKPGKLRHVQELLDAVHRQFIDVVKRGRGDRLKGEDSVLFSGLVWTGEQSLELGLVDELGSSSYVAREIIGAPEIVDFTPRPDFMRRLADEVGVSVVHSLRALVSWPQRLR